MECDSILYVIFSFIGVHCQYNSLPQLKFIYMAFLLLLLQLSLRLFSSNFAIDIYRYHQFLKLILCCINFQNWLVSFNVLGAA